MSIRKIWFWLLKVLMEHGMIQRSKKVKVDSLQHTIYYNPELYEAESMSAEEVRAEGRLVSEADRFRKF